VNFIIEKASQVVETMDFPNGFVFTIQNTFYLFLQAYIAGDPEVAPDHFRAWVSINIGFLDVPYFPARENYPVLTGYAITGVPLVTGFQVAITIIGMNLGDKLLPGILRDGDVSVKVAKQSCIFLRAVPQTILFVIPFKLTYRCGPYRGLLQKQHKA